MRFSHKDKKDPRVVNHSTYPLEFPAKAAEIPAGNGVFVFLNSNADVLYVGHSGKNTLRGSVEAMVDFGKELKVDAFRWFVTKDPGFAEQLSVSWKKKYSPPLNYF